MAPRRAGIALVTAVALIGAVTLMIASTPKAGPTREERQATDGAVIDALLLLNDGGIALARVASRRAAHAKLRQTAAGTEQDLKLQNELMGSIHKRLFGQPAYLAGGGSTVHGGITFSDSVPALDLGTLRTARPLDRELIDLMIDVERRAGAIARAQVRGGSDADLKRFAAGLANRADARAMRFNAWRRAWYGAGSPAMRDAGSGGSMSGMTMP